MDERVTFILGILIGLFVYWLIYGTYWRRWRRILDRDMAYMREKLKAAEDTNFALERNLAVQKGDLPSLRSKITDLERENRKVQAQLEQAISEKQSLIMFTDALRVEVAGYKKAMTDSILPTLPQPRHLNGKTHDAVPPMPRVQAGPKVPAGKPVTPQVPRVPTTPPVGDKIPVALPIPADFAIPAPVPLNGAGENMREALKASSFSSRVTADLPTDQLLTDPVMIIARPWIGHDRLEIIQGVGPTVAKKLNQAGIDSFQALSALPAERFTEIVGPRSAKLMDVEGILQQAKNLVGERNRRQ